MENQHSKSITLIVFSIVFIWACNDAGKKDTYHAQESAEKVKIDKKNQDEQKLSGSNKKNSESDVLQTKTSNSESSKTDTSISDIQALETKSKGVKSNPQIAKNKKIYPTMKFENEVFDFGEITEGDTIKFNFKFKNTGKKTLEIKSADATCGCTQPSFPFLGVDPGQEGNIGVRYISVGKSGPQEATITVKSNADMPTKKLFLKGIVNEKKNEANNNKEPKLKP